MASDHEPIPDDILEAMLAGKAIMRIRPLAGVESAFIPDSHRAPIFLRLQARAESEDQPTIFEAALTPEQARSVVRSLEEALRRARNP